MATLPEPQDENTGTSVRSDQDFVGAPVPRAKVTISDVARTAGVSMSTASRVIRGASEVSPRTRERVMNAVEATGYTADPFARTLRSSGNLGLVGVVVPDIEDPYFARLYSSVQELALARGEGTLLGSHLEDYSAQSAIVDQLALYRPAAVVLVPAPGTTAQDVERLQAQGIGVVTVDRPVPGAVVDCVLAENEAGAETLVATVLRPDDVVAVAMLPRRIWTQERRLATVLAALDRRGVQPVEVVEEAAAQAPTSTAFAPVLRRGVSVVISLSVTPAMGVIRQQMELGFQDVRIAAFDTHPWFDLIAPRVTTVSQNPREVAAAVDRLVIRRRARPQAGVETAILPFSLGGNRSPLRQSTTD